MSSPDDRYCVQCDDGYGRVEGAVKAEDHLVADLDLAFDALSAPPMHRLALCIGVLLRPRSQPAGLHYHEPWAHAPSA